MLPPHGREMSAQEGPRPGRNGIHVGWQQGLWSEAEHEGREGPGSHLLRPHVRRAAGKQVLRCWSCADREEPSPTPPDQGTASPGPETQTDVCFGISPLLLPACLLQHHVGTPPSNRATLSPSLSLPLLFGPSTSGRRPAPFENLPIGASRCWPEPADRRSPAHHTDAARSPLILWLFQAP